MENIKPRIHNLDLLRGIAAIGVLLGHAGSIIDTNIPASYFAFLAKYSVAFFLALSGFVIGYNYEPFKFDIGLFIYKRFKRIYPILIACLILTFVLDNLRFYIPYINDDFKCCFNISTFISSALLFDQLFLFNYLGLTADKTTYFNEFGSNRVLWTLSLEWSIYMLYALFFSKKPCKKRYLILAFPYALIAILSFSFTRIPFLMLCWMLGFFISLNLNINRFIYLPIFFILLLISFFNNPDIIYLSAPFFIVFFTRLSSSRIINYFGNFLGNISYPLYLCHYPIILLLAPLVINLGKYPTIFLVSIVSILVSYLLYLFIDKRREFILELFKFNASKN